MSQGVFTTLGLERTIRAGATAVLGEYSIICSLLHCLSWVHCMSWVQQVTALQAVEMDGVSTDRTKHTLIAYCNGRADSNSPVRLPCPAAKDTMSLDTAQAACHDSLFLRSCCPACSLQMYCHTYLDVLFTPCSFVAFAVLPLVNCAA